MILSQIRLRNFRNHSDSSIEFGSGVNALLGDNGQGKTNVLEAVSYLSLTKSFYASGDAVALQIGKPAFEVEGSMITAGGVAHRVCVRYTRANGEKEYTINRVGPETLSSVIGRFPLVILSPEKSAVTFGGPVERRKFVDLILSQVSRAYLEDLLEYRRVLRQRNRLLADARFGRGVEPGMIEPWTLGLVERGARVILRRRQFVEEFGPYVSASYRGVVRGIEEPGLSYRGTVSAEPGDDVVAIAGRFREALAGRFEEEQKRGLTLVGPHRDDLELVIGGMGVQLYASQGQHKSLLVALKLAEFFYVQERLQEQPVVLLDDVFSELDQHRSRRMLAMIADLGQTIITATDEGVFHSSIDWNDHHRRYRIESGTCRPFLPEGRIRRSEAGGSGA